MSLRAIVNTDHKNRLTETKAVEIEHPSDILVKVEYAAQNPIDVILEDNNMLTDGKIAGNDLFGVVKAIGDGVRDRTLVGKRVAAFTDGHNNQYRSGSFADYAIAKDGIYIVIPDSIGGAEASTLPLAFVTAVHGLYAKTRLGLERGANPQKVLVWGGNSSVGRYAIQLARLGGHHVITTASGSKDELLKLGASEVYDYTDATMAQDLIKKDGEIKYIFDAVGTSSSAAGSAKAAGSAASKYTTVRPDAAHTEGFPENITISTIIVYQVFFESGEETDLGREFTQEAAAWLANGSLVPNRPKVLGGLDSVAEGYQLHRDHKIRGVKLVYEVASGSKI